MSTAVIWSKSKPDVKLQYGGHLGEFHGMSSQSHVSHCRVLPLGEFTVMISEPHVTLQGAVTWRNQCHDRATLRGVIIPSAILKIVSRWFLRVQNHPVSTVPGYVVYHQTRDVSGQSLFSWPTCMLAFSSSLSARIRQQPVHLTWVGRDSPHHVTQSATLATF